MPLTVADSFVIVCSLILGSFLNVVAFRTLKRESIVFPPSHCPSCHRRLTIPELIPIVSYLILRGKCRYCHEPISILYPLGEAMTAVSFFIVYWSHGFSAELFVGWVLCALLVVSVLTDLKEKLILDVVTIPGLIFFLILRVLIGEQPFWFYVVGGIFGFLLLGAIAWISRGGMGGGDIKLYAVIGVALGPWMTLMSLVFASLFGAIIGGLLLVMGVIKRRQPIPFAPFIWAGTLVTYVYGDHVWDWYFHVW